MGPGAATVRLSTLLEPVTTPATIGARAPSCSTWPATIGDALVLKIPTRPIVPMIEAGVMGDGLVR